MSDTDKYTQYVMPKVTLQPHETLRIYGKNCMDVESLGAFCMNFNISEGETLTLSKEKQAVDFVTIPKMADNAIYVRDFFTGKFLEKMK